MRQTTVTPSSCTAGLETHDPDELEYVGSHIKTPAGASVNLSCGTAKPNVFIWGFTKPGTDNNVALAYNYGHGTVVQSQASALGNVRVAANLSELVIEGLRKEAGGTYTCQALYDTDEGAWFTFYFTRLDVEGD